MEFSEYRKLDATALAQAVAGGAVSAGELLALALARHRAVNGQINAVCRLMEDQARAQLSAGVSGPLAGVPFLIKDIGQHYAGVPTSEGNRVLATQNATVHAAVVRRFLDAGLVIFGKTNLPEFALKGVTDSECFGVCRNPWNLGRTPGGSSGGSAAAVAAGIVPMASGSDGGGSIRIPAACCALFGLRPSRGRISAAPAVGEEWHGASSLGVLTRSVRDSALALDVLHGPEPGDPFIIAPPPSSYRQLMCRDPGVLRIGFSAASPIGTPVHPEAVAAVTHAARLLERLGHRVEEAAPEIDGAALAASYLQLYFGPTAAVVQQARLRGARDSDFELVTLVLEAMGKVATAEDFSRCNSQWNAFARPLADFHRRYDMLLTPTLAHPPVVHGAGNLTGTQRGLLEFLRRSGLLASMMRLGLLQPEMDRFARGNMSYVPFTQLANLTGTPAMSVPLHWCADGLPLGVQFIAAFGQEERLLQLARQLEAAQPWFERLPEAIATA